MPSKVTSSSYLSDTYRYYSKQDINISVDASRLSQTLNPYDVLPDAYELHEVLQALTGNQIRTQTSSIPEPVNTIGVVFADRYAFDHSVLGVMFDRGFTTTDDTDSSPEALSVPRQGSAVFVEAIADLRGDGDPFVNELCFTTVHEVGHIFNLQHNLDTSSPTFMSVSQTNGPFPPSDEVFNSDEQSLLGQCSTNPHVYPGGLPFGDSDDTASYNGPRAEGDRMEGRALGLSVIQLDRTSFHRFEPVEARRHASQLHRFLAGCQSAR